MQAFSLDSPQITVSIKAKDYQLDLFELEALLEENCKGPMPEEEIAFQEWAGPFDEALGDRLPGLSSGELYKLVWYIRCEYNAYKKKFAQQLMQDSGLEPTPSPLPPDNPAC